MSFAELCGLVSIPSCVRVSNAVVILSLISFLSFGWCWAALRSRHISFNDRLNVQPLFNLQSS